MTDHDCAQLVFENVVLRAEVERLRAALATQASDRAIAEQTYHDMGVEIQQLRAALATRAEPPTNDKIADAIAHALRTAASGQRHVHAAHHGCEGCARAATAAVVRLLTAAGSATPEEDEL